MNDNDIDVYDAMRQQLQMIIDIGFDYDGYKTAKDLMELIDELVQFARDGLNGIRPQYIQLTEDKKRIVVHHPFNQEASIVPEKDYSKGMKEYLKVMKDISTRRTK